MIMDVIFAILFTIVGICTFIAGCCGFYHQFLISTCCFFMATALFIEHNQTKE